MDGLLERILLLPGPFSGIFVGKYRAKLFIEERIKALRVEL